MAKYTYTLNQKVIYEGDIVRIVEIDQFDDNLPYLIEYTGGGTDWVATRDLTSNNKTVRDLLKILDN